MEIIRRSKNFFAGSFLGILLCLTPATSRADFGIGISITIAPPELPVYVQPPCPTEGYLWTPGYWAYGEEGYYWVPGAWVEPPSIGVLWTPGYWGFGGGIYGWHAGYWGPHVGFYGGVNYGFGYGGRGFGGGDWSGDHFRYNTAVMNVNTTVVHNTYVDRTVINNTTINNTTVNRTSFNGPGGVAAKPTPQEQAAIHEQHIQPTTHQIAHEQTFAHDRTALASVNHGKPAVAAVRTVGEHPAPQTHVQSAATPNRGVQQAQPQAHAHGTPPSANVNHPAQSNVSHPVQPNANRPVQPNVSHSSPPPARPNVESRPPSHPNVARSAPPPPHAAPPPHPAPHAAPPPRPEEKHK